MGDEGVQECFYSPRDYNRIRSGKPSVSSDVKSLLKPFLKMRETSTRVKSQRYTSPFLSVCSDGDVFR